MLARYFGLGLLALIGLAPPVMAAPPIDAGKPIYMDADKLGYDQTNAIVVALGNVRVVQGSSTLFADRITYYQQQNVVRASGNIRVEDSAKGETYFADQVQLKDDLLQGVIANFRVRMSDNSQFAAREAKRLNAQEIELKRAVYSPCKVCENKSPFWQMKAHKVEINDAEQEVVYEDVTMEMMGLPVFYTPYFLHPTPNADAKSGFLLPTYSQSSNLGFSIKTPYYLALSPSAAATFTPFITTKEGPVMMGEYYKLFDGGFLSLDGSVTYPNKRDDLGTKLSENELRGHLFANGQTALSEHWSAGFDLNRASDDTYLRRYGFSSPRSLTSRLFSEGRYGRSYALVEGLAFQGLDISIDPDSEPYVLPLAEGYYESEAGLFGVGALRHYASASSQIIARREATQSRRVSVSQGVKLPLTSSGGHLMDMQLENRFDAYSVDDVVTSSGNTIEEDEVVRYVPTAAAKWRYPLIRHGESSSLTIEPTVLAVARPNDSNRESIPNEDNNIVELSDVNLFEINPFPGYDTIDTGSRVAYGLAGHWWRQKGGRVFFSAGQNANLASDTPFPYNNTGESLSDYVGRVSFQYDPFEVHYRMRLDQETLGFNNQAIGLRFTQHPVRFDVDYVTFENDAYLDDREEIVTAAAYDIHPEWTLNGNMRRDLLLNRMIYAGAGVTYHNECFTLDTAFSRAFIEDRDVEPDTSFMVRVSFKNLTE